MKLKVVHYFNSTVVGGAERIALDLISQLDPACFEVLLVAPPKLLVSLRERLPENVLECKPIEVGNWEDINSALDLAKRILRRWTDAAGLFALGRYLKLTGAHVIHAHQYSASIPAVLAAHLVGCKVVYTTHIRESWRTKFKMDRTIANWTDRIIAVSYQDREFLTRSKGLPPNKIKVIQNGIEPAPYLSIGASRSDCRGHLVIGAVGRLHEQKGHIYLIRALRRLLDAGYEAECFIAGTGPLESELNAEIRRLGLGEVVRLLGHRTDIPALLEQCDIFAQPSFYEGLPLSVLEAMAAGRPVVATLVDGIPEAVAHGETGLLVQPGDDVALAKALEHLAASPQLRQSMGESGRKRLLREFTLQRMVHETQDLYTSLASSN